MANNINSILNVAGNWWKGLPAPVYYDMYENDSDFDDAVASFDDTYLDEPDISDDAYIDESDIFGEEYFDESDIFDDEFEIEKVIYQMDKPDVMTTPYGDPVTDDIMATILAEYPAIEALSASPDDMEGDDHYDDDVWEDYFHYADVFLEEAGDEIDALIEAVETKTASEGKIGEEGEVYSAVGDQIAASTQNEIDTALQTGITSEPEAKDLWVQQILSGEADAEGQALPTDLAYDEWKQQAGPAVPKTLAAEDTPPEEPGDGDEGWVEKALDMGKEVLSSITDAFTNPSFLPQDVMASTESLVQQPDMTPLDMTPPIAADEDDPSFWSEVATFVGDAAKNAWESTGSTVMDTIAESSFLPTNFLPGYPDRDTEEIVAGILSENLFEADPLTGYGATMPEILEELLKDDNVPPDVIAALVQNPEFQAQAQAAGQDIDLAMSAIQSAFNLTGETAADTTAGGLFGLTPMLENAGFEEGAKTALEDTTTTPITSTTTAATTAATTTPKTEFEKGAEGALTPVTATDKDWSEDIRKVFYTKMYARPGAGTAQVIEALPSLYSQTRTLFLMERGENLFKNITLIEDEGTHPDVRKALRETMEKEYDVFLEAYLKAPREYRTGTNFRRLSGEISSMLRKEQNEPNKEIWDNTDQQKLIWVRGLFGDHDLGRTNRRNLVNLSLTNGGMGYYSQHIHASADKLAQYYRNIGWSETKIFGHMMGLSGATLEGATDAATTQAAAKKTIETPFAPTTPTDTTLSKPLQETLGVGDPNYYDEFPKGLIDALQKQDAPSDLSYEEYWDTQGSPIQPSTVTDPPISQKMFPPSAYKGDPNVYDNVPYGFLQAKANALQKQDMAPSDLSYSEWLNQQGTPMATMGSAGGMVVPIEATPQPAQLPFQQDLWLAQYLAELENAKPLSPLEEAKLRPFLNKAKGLPTFMTE